MTIYSVLHNYFIFQIVLCTNEITMFELQFSAAAFDMQVGTAPVEPFHTTRYDLIGTIREQCITISTNFQNNNLTICQS
jgi:hypothetical protein